MSMTRLVFHMTLLRLKKAYVDKTFRGKRFKTDNDRSKDGFQRGLAYMVYSFFRQKDKSD